MTLTFLGTGTSQGVPVIACDCPTCTSADARDKRTRTSALLTWQGRNVVIDTGPDFREQMLREKIRDLDAVLLTHEHRDHIGGLDDVRPINFKYHKEVPVFATAPVIAALLRSFPYFLDENYPGRPRFVFTEINKHTPFVAAGQTIIPIEAQHGEGPVLGFRVGDFVYMTDARHIAPEELDKMRGCRILVLNALQHQPHYSHFTLSEALEIVAKLNPEQAYFVHMSHGLGKHEDVCKTLPPNVTLAYDGLVVEV